MTTSGPGRPRDPAVDRRILDAALEVYGRDGWGGFRVEAVAKHAGAGKASVYLRWHSGEELLAEALSHLGHIEDIDTGDVRTDLMRLAEQIRDRHLGSTGRAAQRLAVEAHQVPAIEQRWKAARDAQVSAARSLVRRAIARGELPPGTSVTLLLDLLLGSTTMHLQAAPDHLAEKSARTSSDYIREVVDFLLDAFRARSIAAEDRAAVSHS
ncbi:TetR/AcrR family transcriptional regulator [Nocardia sp. alder85J]|uniref:TetR/AcrR family transcriptional regulator n=1 Tax=Nocardia sp. alder85J TaxID=2862949 RepID=UPI001CD3358F|nr:TetR/AcrR family transcriptional regulator [Nocardia sp. alder85J]MCX4098599.1 TetR/AcrR family transcriptional regulator [Nocardia sp. alder85J]